MGVYIGEFIGTAILLLLGNGVVANNNLVKTGGKNAGVLFINTAWGFAVFVAALSTGWVSGAHLNPAVTLGLWYAGKFQASLIMGYIIAQVLGAMFGSFCVWLAYKKHYDETTDANAILGSFSTGSGINAPLWNCVTEIIGTVILVFGILAFTNNNNEIIGLAPLLVGFLVWSIGMSLGGPTGYAINPARDLGPRIMHMLLPIPHKGSSNFQYAWIPIVGPCIGGVLGAMLYNILLHASNMM